MTTEFKAVTVGSVIQMQNGRRLIKVSSKSRQNNALDLDDRDFIVADNAPVSILSSPVKMGKALLKAYRDKEAQEFQERFMPETIL